MKVRLKGEVVDKILTKMNKSQNWLAYRMKISSGYMAQLMNGTRNPAPKMRGKIMKRLKGYEWDDLFEIIEKGDQE